MNKILSILICILAAIPVFAVNKSDEEVTLTNVQVSRENTTFVVTYDITLGSGLKSCNVALLLSDDAGKSFIEVGDRYLSGDFGKVESSGRKTIRYDFSHSKEQLADQDLAFKVEVTGKKAAMEQILDVSTNLFDWLDLATINLDASIPVSRHFTVQFGGKFNGWEFKNSEGSDSLTKNQQQSVSVGARYWPRGTYSKLWICSKLQYCKYSETGVWRQALDEGKAVGAGLSVGYMWRIGNHLAVDLGGGFWGGRLLEHALYDCPCESCLQHPRQAGPKGFVALNDLNISLHWLF